MTIDWNECNTIADWKQRENQIDILNHQSIQIIQWFGFDGSYYFTDCIDIDTDIIKYKNNNEMMNNNFHKHKALNCTMI